MLSCENCLVRGVTDVLYQGNTLYFETADQPMPDVTKSKQLMALRIYDVDNDAKKSIL